MVNFNEEQCIGIYKDKTLKEEEDIHGLDPLADRNPLLPVAAAYEDLIDKIESSPTKPEAGYLEVYFSGSYQSRPVQCRYTDCPTTSLPSTLGLLPFAPWSGQEWLCTDHRHCLLCTDCITSTESVTCVSCARMFHTSHLAYEIQDQLEKELFICKLCSDPDLVTKHNPHRDKQANLKDRKSSQKYQAPRLNHSILPLVPGRSQEPVK